MQENSRFKVLRSNNHLIIVTAKTNNFVGRTSHPTAAWNQYLTVQKVNTNTNVRQNEPEEIFREIYSVLGPDNDCCYPRVMSTDEGKIRIEMKIDGENKNVTFPAGIEAGVDYDLHVMMCNATESNGSLAIAERLGVPQVYKNLKLKTQD